MRTHLDKRIVWNFTSAAIGLTIISTACASQAMIRKPSLEEAPASYFRVTADYTVIETGEEISFDYVVGCGGIISHYSYTTPSVIYAAHPTMQYLPTESGEAIGIKSPGTLCDQRRFEFVPADFRPFMMWFPDVQDLSFAWGYATEIAYESPNAHVSFHGANVEPATEAEWRENRAALAATYAQVGALPGPWGDSFSRGPIEEMVQSYLKGKGRGAAEICDGYSRLSLSADLTAELFESASADVGQYWLMDRAASSDVWKRLRKADVDFNGRPFNDHLRSGEGTVLRSKGGTITTNFKYHEITDVFPILPIRQSMDAAGVDLDTPPDEYFRTTLVSPDWNGFSACWSDGDPLVTPGARNPFFERPEFLETSDEFDRPNPYDPDAREKPHWLNLNETRMGANPIRQPGAPWILDRKGNLYFPNGWGARSVT